LNFETFLCVIVLSRLMSPLSKDETRRDSSLTLTISHYTVIKTRFMHRRGKWGGKGGSCSPWKYFGPPWTTFTPSQSCILGYNSQGTLVSRSKRRSKSGVFFIFIFF